MMSIRRSTLTVLLAMILLLVQMAGAAAESGQSRAVRSTRWLDQVLNVPYPVFKPQDLKKPMLQLLRQDYEKLMVNQSVVGTPLKIGQQDFKRGLGTHSVSHLRVYSPEPIKKFEAMIGVDNNDRTQGQGGSVTFAVSDNKAELYRSPLMRGGEDSRKVEVDTKGTRAIDLLVGDGGDGPPCDHADWAEAKIITQSGNEIFLDQIEQGTVPIFTTLYPFSFVYGGKKSDEILSGWVIEKKSKSLGDGRNQEITTWTDPASGLKVTWEATRFPDYPAVEWMLYFENTGKQNTPILEDIQSCDLSLNQRFTPGQPYLLHKTHGGDSTVNDFAYSTAVLDEKHSERLAGLGGRSSQGDFPFFKLDTGQGSMIFAIGWSGQWAADLTCPDSANLRVRAGLEKTHFLLHPGEKVRMPRILVLHWEGESWESNAQFRQMIYKYYAAKRDGKTPLPIPFCNTCFTRGGGWLNECNEQNQISLIKAYSKLGLEALWTDAGWFTGGWPGGAGNWDPRKDAYPNGMGPVAAAAKENNMIYGLWFEPERVMAGTTVQREHPEWCLAQADMAGQTYLLNFGLPEVQDYFFNIVKGFMDLPGFRVYRQDFNMDPLVYWLHNDAPDRQGITEIKYIEGLYAFWDRLAEAWPDSLREECASGGRRIDLETVMRMHLHQDSDLWFQDEVDQTQIWGLSQYLPNNVFVGHLNRLDDYSFHSVMASSLCLGWIADAPDFDSARGKKLLERYRQLRHLLVGAWYPITTSSQDKNLWIASQYHRADLGEGLVLAFRHAESPYPTLEISLRGLKSEATYEVTLDSAGQTRRGVKGSDLMKDYSVPIAQKRGSELIHYKEEKP